MTCAILSTVAANFGRSWSIGSRYEAQAPLPEVVTRAALLLIDLLSFQRLTLPAEFKPALERRANFSGPPILLADIAHWAKRFTPGRSFRTVARMPQLPAKS